MHMNNIILALLKFCLCASLVGLSTAKVYAADVVDNGTANFSTVGSWGNSTYTTDFYGTDYAYANAGTGSQTASWTFSVGADGQYAIDAWWTEYRNRASNAAYAIYNNGALLATIRVDQRINGGIFNRLSDLPIQAGTITIVLSDDADGVVIADAIQVTYLNPAQNNAPDGIIVNPTGDLSIAVGDSVGFTGSGTDIDNNTPLSYLWNFGVGSGIDDSILQSPTVQFNTVGTFTVSLTVTDTLGLADPTPATITVIVQSADAGVIYDNGGTSFSTIGTWGTSNYAPGYYGSDYAYANAGTGSQTASWTSSVEADGQYALDAWWTSHSNRASNAPYSIYNNGVLLTTVRVDQRINGGVFNRLVDLPLEAGTVTIVLSDDADGVVIADAVQITYLGLAQNDWTDKGVVLTGGNTGSWDVNLYGALSPATVVKKNGTYYLYYVGADGVRTTDGGPRHRALGVATSNDGINFTKYSGNPIITFLPHNNEEEGLYSAGATVDDNGDIVLYYSACEAANETSQEVNCSGYLATSSDGLNFTEQGVVIDSKNTDVWGSGDEIFPVGAYKYNNIYYVYYIAKGTDAYWDLGVAWGTSRSNLSNTKPVLTTGSYIIGGLDPMWLTPDQITLFIMRDFTTRTIEVRTASPDSPAVVSSPITSFQLDGVKQITVFHDNDIGQLFMYYMNSTFDAIGVKVAGPGIIPVPK